MHVVFKTTSIVGPIKGYIQYMKEKMFLQLYKTFVIAIVEYNVI